MVLPADDQTAEVMQPGKEPLDLPAPTITTQFASILGFTAAARGVRRDHANAILLPQSLVQRIAVIGPIANQESGCCRSEALLEGCFHQLGFMRRSACNPHGERKTMAVRNCHDLGPFAAACWTNSTAPFFAPAKVASIKVSAKSNCPRASRSRARVRSISTRTPSRTHCWKRLWQVWYGGYFLGISAHCAPVRSTHNTPSSTERVSRHGLPRRELGVLGSTNGFNNSHCTSVRSMLLICLQTQFFTITYSDSYL